MNQQLPLPQQEEIHLQDYINVIVRRRRTFVVSFLAVVIAVTLYTFLVPPTYESTATLFVKDDKGKVGQMGDLLLNNPTPIDSEIEILKSRSNAEKVVSSLHLDWEISKRTKGVDFRLVEFSSATPAVDEPNYLVELQGGGSYNVKNADGVLLGSGSEGQLMRGKGISLLLLDIKGQKGDTFRLTLHPYYGTVESLMKGIKVGEVGKKTNVMSISYRSRSSQRAYDVVNTLVQVYLEQGVALRAQEATRTVGFVEEQLKGVKEDLERAEKNLESYKSGSGVIDLDTEAQSLIQTLTEAEKQKAEAGLQRKQFEFALASLKDARRRGVPYSPSVMRDDPVLSGLASRLAELEVQKKGRLAESTESHPTVKAVQAQIDEVVNKIQSTYETTLRNTQAQERALTVQIAQRDAQLKKLPVAERDLARLLRVTKVDASIYTFLLQKHEEARIAKASTINNISVVDPAIVAEKPVSPKKVKNLVLGILVGLMFGSGLCFFWEYLDDTLKDPESSRKALALPLLSVIPYISDKDGEQALISHNSPKSPASEAFRSLRTALHFCAVRKDKKVILVTSTFPGEGKSTVSSNLAITLAQTGAKVLIVDCDLRRSTLHEKFGFERGEGLTGLLAGDLNLKSVVHSTSIEGLDLLTAGIIPPNPSELLGSEAMGRLTVEMRDSYSHVIIDAPPVLAVTDAPLLTQISDLVVVVLETGRVPLKAAQRTRDTLLAASAPLAGIVVSDRTSAALGYGYGYGHGYGYGYGDTSDGPTKKPWWKFGRG
jgi:capsular exopolysaccharide synthesis family protein